MGLFNKLFGKNMDSRNSFEIDFTKSGVAINDQYIQIPVKITTLTELFGESEIIKAEGNSIYIWHDIGIRGFSNDEQSIFELDIQLMKMNHNQFFPRKKYFGGLRIEGKVYTDYVKIAKDDYIFKEYKIEDMELSVMLTKEEPKQIRSISIDKPEPEEQTNKTNRDKYNLKKSIPDKIEFKDFNFKLAIIEELMYNKEVLKPKFDVFEFIELYEGRKINVDEEGYDLIPEVVAYFEDLEIDKKLAEQITEIYQDGGNEIYLNVIPFWDGEDDAFDIRSFEDLIHFPHLNKMTLFGTDPKVFENLQTKGIDAKPL